MIDPVAGFSSQAATTCVVIDPALLATQLILHAGRTESAFTADDLDDAYADLWASSREIDPDTWIADAVRQARPARVEEQLTDALVGLATPESWGRPPRTMRVKRNGGRSGVRPRRRTDLTPSYRSGRSHGVVSCVMNERCPSRSLSRSCTNCPVRSSRLSVCTTVWRVVVPALSKSKTTCMPPMLQDGRAGTGTCSIATSVNPAASSRARRN